MLARDSFRKELQGGNTVDVSSHVQAEMDGVIKDSGTAAGVTSALELSWSQVFEADWEAQVKASYKPLQVTDNLWIIPEWCDLPLYHPCGSFVVPFRMC
jgi:ribosomal protein L11 methylase PrmA